MNDYTWKTDEPHSDNIITMTDYLCVEMNPSWTIDSVDGTYAEITTDFGDRYEVHASGNGDFSNHRVRFELIGGDHEGN